MGHVRHGIWGLHSSHQGPAGCVDQILSSNLFHALRCSTHDNYPQLANEASWAVTFYELPSKQNSAVGIGLDLCKRILTTISGPRFQDRSILPWEIWKLLRLLLYNGMLAVADDTVLGQHQFKRVQAVILEWRVGSFAMARKPCDGSDNKPFTAKLRVLGLSQVFKDWDWTVPIADYTYRCSSCLCNFDAQHNITLE